MCLDNANRRKTATQSRFLFFFRFVFLFPFVLDVPSDLLGLATSGVMRATVDIHKNTVIIGGSLRIVVRSVPP